MCYVFWYAPACFDLIIHVEGDIESDLDWLATIYWAHIGRVIYAASNELLAGLTGPGNKENFTMKWHTRDILEGQQKDIEIIGPVEGMDKVVVEESDVYWKTTRKG
jgi:hypothetical protein